MEAQLEQANLGITATASPAIANPSPAGVAAWHPCSMNNWLQTQCKPMSLKVLPRDDLHACYVSCSDQQVRNEMSSALQSF